MRGVGVVINLFGVRAADNVRGNVAKVVLERIHRLRGCVVSYSEMSVTVCNCLLELILVDSVKVSHRLYSLDGVPINVLIGVKVSVRNRSGLGRITIGTGVGLNTVCTGRGGGSYLTVVPLVICKYFVTALAGLLMLGVVFGCPGVTVVVLFNYICQRTAGTGLLMLSI